MLLKSCFCCICCSCMYVLKLTSIDTLLDEAELHNHHTVCLMYHTWSGKIIKMCTVHQGFSTNSLFQQFHHHGDPCSLGPVGEQTQSLCSLLYQPQLGEYVQTLISSFHSLSPLTWSLTNWNVPLIKNPSADNRVTEEAAINATLTGIKDGPHVAFTAVDEAFEMNHNGQS